MRYFIWIVILSGVYFIGMGVSQWQTLPMVLNESQAEQNRQARINIKTTYTDLKSGSSETFLTSRLRVGRVGSAISPASPYEQYIYALECLEVGRMCPEFTANNDEKKEYVQIVVEHIHSRIEGLLQEIESGRHTILATDEILAQQLGSGTIKSLQYLGIQLLSYMPASEANFNVILDAIKTTTEVSVLELSMKNIRRYSHMQKFEDRLRGALTEQIRLGLNEGTSIFAARAALRYLSPTHVPHFEKLAKEIRPFPRRHQALQETLKQTNPM